MLNHKQRLVLLHILMMTTMITTMTTMMITMTTTITTMITLLIIMTVLTITFQRAIANKRATKTMPTPLLAIKSIKVTMSILTPTINHKVAILMPVMIIKMIKVPKSTQVTIKPTKVLNPSKTQTQKKSRKITIGSRMTMIIKSRFTELFVFI